MKTIYRLEWYLEREVTIKTKWMSNRIKAEEAFDELKNVLGKGCWVSLEEFVENDEAEGFDYGMQIYFEEI
jgi:hypothetical protein